MHTCFEVADFFIANTDQDDEMTMLKLQKLCAYAQGFSLALLGRALFGNELKAYTHGPVVQELYEEYRSEGRNPLTSALSRQDVRLPFSGEELYILETVNNYYGAYTPSRLRNMSHEDFPGKFGTQEVIPMSAVKARFSENRVVKAIDGGC